MVLAVFRSRLRREHEAEFHALEDKIAGLADTMPGLIGYKGFTAEDGERCTIVEFDTPENLRAWREHPEHSKAQKLGRDRFYADYTLQVCESPRESRFEFEGK